MPTGRSSGRGFTLLEILLALVIMSLSAAVLIPSLKPSAGAELRSATRELTAGLRYARSQAVSGGRSVTLTLDLDERRFAVPGSGVRGQLPQSIQLSLYTARSEQLDAGAGGIRFFPDGTSTGGQVTCRTASGLIAQIQVDWMTGRVRIIGPGSMQNTGGA